MQRDAVIIRLVLCVMALLALALPLPRAAVERYYSSGLYLTVQRTVTGWSNQVPFAVLDVAILILLVGGGCVVWRRLRSAGPGDRLRAARHLLFDGAALGAAAYLLFLALWGLNYQRVPLRQRLDFEPERVTRERLRALAEHAVERVNALHDRTAEGEWPSLDELPRLLASSFRATQQALGAPPLARPGAPKWSLLSLYFRRSAIDGMIDPFFLEVIVNADVLPFERPFVLAHEWAHLAGYADESEANFVGWLTCIRGPAFAQYSGWLALYVQAISALPEEARAAIAAGLEPGPRADLRAMAERFRRSVPVVRRAARRVYDRFLKANRVESGVASYSEVITLVLGTRFGDNWTPRVERRRQTTHFAGVPSASSPVAGAGQVHP